MPDAAGSPDSHLTSLRRLSYSLLAVAVLVVEAYHYFVRDAGWLESVIGLVLGLGLGSVLIWYIRRRMTRRARMATEATVSAHDIESFGQDLVSQMQEGILREDVEGRITFVNQATCDLLGYEREELFGQHWSTIVSPESLSAVREEMSSRPEGRSSRYRADLLSKGGQSLPVLVSARPLFAANGYDGVLSVFTDIRRLEQAEKDLRWRNERLSSLYAISTAANRYMELQQVLATALDVVTRVTGADGSAVFLYDPDSERLSSVASHHVPGPLLESLSSLERGDGILSQAVTRGEPVVVLEGLRGTDDGLPGTVAGAYHVLIAVPLIHRGAPLGVFTLLFREDRETTPDEIEWLNSAGRQIALAINNVQMFERVQRARQEWEATVDSIGDAMLIHDRDYRVLRVNRALAEWCRMPTRAIVGHGCQELTGVLCGALCAHDCPAFGPSFGSEPAIDEFTLTDPLRIIERHTYPVRDQDGEAIAAVHLFRDVTESRRMQEELGQAGKLATMGQLISSVAHELNNPLTVILGNASLLESDAAPADIPQCVSEIRTAAQRCTRAVEDLLAFSRPHEPTREAVDVNACIKEALRWETSKLHTRGIEIVTKLAPVPVTLADPHQLQQLFLNILVNARQALAANSKPGTLRIRTLHLADNTIRVEVSDNGAGIPLEHQTRIFEPFFTTKEEGKGTGLGLAICARIIDEHGGRISVRSREGEGSTFVIDLPVVSQGEQSLETTEDAAAALAPAVPLSALIVDDEPDVARVVQLSLQRAGHRCAVEVSGVRAAERLAIESFDVIFMDLRMPDLSGPALYRKLRESLPEAAERVVFITGDTADPATLEFLRYSGRPWLTKPFTEEEVWRTMAETQDTQ